MQTLSGRLPISLPHWCAWETCNFMSFELLVLYALHPFHDAAKRCNLRCHKPLPPVSITFTSIVSAMPTKAPDQFFVVSQLCCMLGFHNKITCMAKTAHCQTPIKLRIVSVLPGLLAQLPLLFRRQWGFCTDELITAAVKGTVKSGSKGALSQALAS